MCVLECGANNVSEESEIGVHRVSCIMKHKVIKLWIFYTKFEVQSCTILISKNLLVFFGDSSQSNFKSTLANIFKKCCFKSSELFFINVLFRAVFSSF